MKIFVVDDLVEIVPLFLDALESVVGKSNVVYCPDASRAVDMFSGQQYDVAFVDLKLKTGSGTFYSGIQLGSSFHKFNNSCVIVMYSADIKSEREKEFNHYNDCVEAGADDVMSRQTLFSWSGEILKKRILAWREAKLEILKREIAVTFRDDIRTLAITETLTENTIVQLLRKFLPTQHVHLFSGLQAGYSGNMVALVISRQSPAGGTEMRNILKIGQSTFALNDELRRKPLKGSNLDYIGKSPTPTVEVCNGWAAIMIPEVRDAIPLETHLNGITKLTNQNKVVLQNVFEKSLVQPALEQISTPANSPDTYSLGHAFASHVLDVLNDIKSWKSVLNKTNLKATGEVIDFVHRSLNDTTHWGCKLRSFALLHGDFHCKNIFVTTYGEPVVIDFGRSDYYPRLFDFAALDCDLILSCYDNKDGNAHLFTNLKNWISTTTKQFPYFDNVNNSETNKILEVRALALSLMCERLGSVTAAQYADCLIMHYLRYLRFNISPVKKALAVNLIYKLVKKFGF